MKKTFFLTVLIVSLAILKSLPVQAATLYYYQLKVYHFKTKEQEGRLERYFQSALLPALHRAGIPRVGIFKPIVKDTDNRMYILTPFKTWKSLESIDDELLNDPAYLVAGSDYINATYNDYPYSRIETIILRAFPDMKGPELPILTGTKSDRVYELRSYENPTEKACLSKMKMFNEGGEINLFKKLGFNAIFYGKVIAGNRMPNLMYMTSFDNKSKRDQHWDNFAGNPEWKVLVAKPEYQHNLNNANIWLLYAMSYSDY